MRSMPSARGDAPKRKVGGQPKRGVPARNNVQVRLTDAELTRLEAQAKPGESRSDIVRRFLGIGA